MWLRTLSLLTMFLPMQALATDWYTGARQQPQGDDWVVTADGSVDLTTQASYFGDVMVTAAPGGTLAESGLRARVDGLAGRYQYFATDISQTVHGTQETGTALLGYEWVSPTMSFSAYLGADVRDNKLSIADPQNPVNGMSVGGKVAVELYARPTALTMIQANASFASNETAYFARLRGGYLIGSDLYVGPEFLALGDAFFNQERIGVHLTGFQAGPVRFAFAAGYLHDRVRGDGGYGTFDARVGF